MKIKTNKLYPIVCAVLAAALLLSVIGFFTARSNAKELEEEVAALLDENQQLKLLNQALEAQVGIWENNETYCELSVGEWSEQNGTLNVYAYAQAFLPAGAQTNARMELWHGPDVIGSEPVTLMPGEGGAYEAEVSATFKVPTLQADEELQLWLVIDSDSFNTISSCGAGWYEEDGQLMVIAG